MEHRSRDPRYTEEEQYLLWFGKIFVVLLAQFRAVTHLELRGQVFSYIEPLTQLVHHCILGESPHNGVRPLGKIREIYLSHWNNEGDEHFESHWDIKSDEHFEYFNSLHYLPTLTSIEGYRLSDLHNLHNPWDNDLRQLPPDILELENQLAARAIPHVKTVKLRHSNIYPGSLFQFVKDMPGVEAVVYSHDIGGEYCEHDFRCGRTDCWDDLITYDDDFYKGAKDRLEERVLQAWYWRINLENVFVVFRYGASDAIVLGLHRDS